MDKLTNENSGNEDGFVLILNLSGPQLMKTNAYAVDGDFTAGSDSHNLFTQKQEPIVESPSAA